MSLHDCPRSLRPTNASYAIGVLAMTLSPYSALQESETESFDNITALLQGCQARRANGFAKPDSIPSGSYFRRLCGQNQCREPQWHDFVLDNIQHHWPLCCDGHRVWCRDLVRTGMHNDFGCDRST